MMSLNEVSELMMENGSCWNVQEGRRDNGFFEVHPNAEEAKVEDILQFSTLQEIETWARQIQKNLKMSSEEYACYLEMLRRQ
jgi:hypothetical protein